MQAINKVVTTSLFWETLGELRGTSRYEKIRSDIRDLVKKKSESRMPINSRDKIFNEKRLHQLQGIWHCSISRNPDVVLFYDMDGDALTLGMLGRHDDFPAGSHNVSRSIGVGSRIRNAIAEGHEPSPLWSGIKWQKPTDLIDNPEVEELSMTALQNLADALYMESQDAPMFKRLNGIDLLEADETEIGAWLDDVERAHTRVLEVMRRPLMSPDVKLLANGI